MHNNLTKRLIDSYPMNIIHPSNTVLVACPNKQSCIDINVNRGWVKQIHNSVRTCAKQQLRVCTDSPEDKYYCTQTLPFNPSWFQLLGTRN